MVVGELLLSLCGALLHRPKWRIGTTIYQIRELNITDLPLFKVYSFFYLLAKYEYVNDSPDMFRKDCDDAGMRHALLGLNVEL